jgi:hypothetical protein
VSVKRNKVFMMDDKGRVRMLFRTKVKREVYDFIYPAVAAR